MKVQLTLGMLAISASLPLYAQSTGQLYGITGVHGCGANEGFSNTDVDLMLRNIHTGRVLKATTCITP